METVKIHIAIHIDSEDTVDTGYTVDEWNSLSQDERSGIARDNWEAMASRDDGGMHVVTEGAEEI